MAFVIKDKDSMYGQCWLKQLARHLGAQAGSSRQWSLEQEHAMRFDTRTEAEAAIEREFGPTASSYQLSVCEVA